MIQHENRYIRQIAMPEIGEQGQERLRQSRVLVVEAGGLGSPLLYYLAAAGVGNIAIADYDVVDESNLNRQILHSVKDIGVPKVDSARNTLESLNPNIKIDSRNVRVSAKNLFSISRDADLVLDAVDSFGAKFSLQRKRFLPLMHR